MQSSRSLKLNDKIKLMRIVRKIESLIVFGVPLLFIAGISGAITGALPYGAGSYGSCQYSTCMITLSTSGNVSLDVTPSIGGAYTITSDEVMVSTGSSTGYTLTLIDSDTQNNLADGSNTIEAVSGTVTDPVMLTSDSWGYRVDATGGFGTGPTTEQQSVQSSALTFAAVPISSQSAAIVKSTSAAAVSPESTLVWYGARVTDMKPSGVYTDQVIYTAVTND